jgi:hypothetical protein
MSDKRSWRFSVSIVATQEFEVWDSVLEREEDFLLTTAFRSVLGSIVTADA